MATWSTKAPLRECQLSAHGDLTVTERLATLLDTGQFADVTIRVGQGAEVASFKAHRLLLASASQPLYRLVSTVQGGHADFNTFRVPDVGPRAFSSVLKFIYTDQVDIGSILEAFALLKAGKKWNLIKMNVRTIKYLEDFLDDYTPSTEAKKNELFDLLLLADAHSKELFEQCLSVIIKFAKDLIPCQGFLRLDERTIRRLIGDKNFVFEDQLRLFEAIRDWGMNQILLKGLSPAQLHPIIEALLTHVDFEHIKDNDFMGTILPSECLGRAEVISFFMTRGMEIPRDMGFNNNKQGTSIVQNGEVKDFKKAPRFKKGYRLPHKEIYQEHELRFRADKNIKLLGVGFGFLFSNTDMGVVLHCQGPWETVQWTDMVQTYCRVSWEKMLSADLRLMFTEPPKLEANHCYKVLVKVTRMTAGSTDVELWGGKEGVPYVESDDAKFYFIKAAVNPKKEVEIKDTDTKQGMITELLYVLDEPPPTKIDEINDRRSRPHVEIESETPTPDEDSKQSYTPIKSPKIEDETIDTSLARRRPVDGSDTRWQPASTTSVEPATSKWSAKEKSPEVKDSSRKTSESNDVSSYYARNRPSPIREKRVPETPGFLRQRITPTTSSDSPFGERLSRASTRTTAPSWSRKRVTNDDTTSSTTPATGRYGRDSNTSDTTLSSRYGRDSTSTTTPTSRYGLDSTSTTTPTSRYGRDSTSTATPTSRYGRDSTSTTTPTSRYGRDTTSTALPSSRYGRDTSASRDTTSTISRSSIGDSGTSGSSLYRRDSKTNSSPLSSYRRDSIKDSTTPSSSLYRSDSLTSRYDREKEAAASRYSSRYGRDSSASRYGSSGYSTSRYLSSYVSRYR